MIAEIKCHFNILCNVIYWVLHHTVPQMPTGFRVTEQYPTSTDKTVTLEWDPPQGMGPEVIVDHYWITIIPQPLSHSVTNMVESAPWNVTVDFNTLYTANITAANCAGKSQSFMLPDTRFSKYLLQS